MSWDVPQLDVTKLQQLPDYDNDPHAHYDEPITLDKPVLDVPNPLQAAQYYPENPQWYLRGTARPYAPFVGNPFEWRSDVYDDGTLYEGLMLEEVPQALAVVHMGWLGALGIQETEVGDKYEGEVWMGFAHGLGQYQSWTGEMYKGEYVMGKKHGCGALVDYAPYYEKITDGVKPSEAWSQTKEEIGNKLVWGYWEQDEFVHNPAPEGHPWRCHLAEIGGTIEELHEVVYKARMWRYKPDGDVTIRFMRDEAGQPTPIMQDPIFYKFDTFFMAPGPLALAFDIPESDALRKRMEKEARNYQRIFMKWNPPIRYDVEPGSIYDKANRYWKGIRPIFDIWRDMLNPKDKPWMKWRGTDDDWTGTYEGTKEFHVPPVGGSSSSSKQDQQVVQEQKGQEPVEEEGDDELLAAPVSAPVASISVALGSRALARAMQRLAIRAPPIRKLQKPKKSQQIA